VSSARHQCVMLLINRETLDASRDAWVSNFSSVPSSPEYVVETKHVGTVRNTILEESPAQGRAFVVIVHGCAGAGKTTACKMLAHDAYVRQRFKDGIFWMPLGEESTPAALVEQIALSVKLSGGEETAAFILRHTDGGKWEQAKAELHKWFENRNVLFVLDNIQRSADRALKRWIDVMRDIPSCKCALMCSSRNPPLGANKYVDISQLGRLDQQAVFLSHLQLQPFSRGYLDNRESAQHILKGCAGLPLALAIAAGYLRRDPNGWNALSNRIRMETTSVGQSVFTSSEHPVLASVIRTSLEWLDRAVALPKDCSFSWAELYTSLCVGDPASPGMPLLVLSLMWGMCAESVHQVCQTFISLALIPFLTGEMDNRLVKLHELQRQCCGNLYGHRHMLSQGSPQSLSSDCSQWHGRIIEGLLAKARLPLKSAESTGIGSVAARSGPHTSAAKADALVQAFMGLGQESESVLDNYFGKNLVRHVCGYKEGLVVLAKGVLSDYRWLLAVASRYSPSFAASQYRVAVCHLRERRENVVGSKEGNDAGELGPSFVRGLEDIAHVLRFCVPPRCVSNLLNDGDEGPCPVHGECSEGDPGLAHQLAGRLERASGDGSCRVREASGGGGGGCGLAGLLVASVKRYASTPWLLPVNRGLVGADRQGLEHVIRAEAGRCVAFAYGDSECVAIADKYGGWIYVYNCQSGELVHELHDDLAASMGSIAVAGIDRMWLAVGHNDGSVRIWDLETERCVTTLCAMYGLRYSCSRCVAISPDRSRVTHLTLPNPLRLEDYGLHVWDISSEGTECRYELLHSYEAKSSEPINGCKNVLEFEIASAALLHQDAKREMELCSSRSVKFAQRAESENRRKNSSRKACSARARAFGCPAEIKDTVLREASDDVLSMMVEDELVALVAKSHGLQCSRVTNCDANRVLIAAVDESTGVITLLDALTSKVISKSPPMDASSISSVAASQTADGRILVVTGHEDGVIRMRMADSGELIGHRQGLSTFLGDVTMDFKSRKMMGAYESGLWIWSFEYDGSGERNPASADIVPLRNKSSRTKKHSDFHTRMTFSEDGKVAASFSFSEKFILVWDTAKGTVVRQLDIEEPSEMVLTMVAISRGGDYILCAGRREDKGESAFFSLWDRSNQGILGHFQIVSKRVGSWAAIIEQSADKVQVKILVGLQDDDFCEACEWTCSGSDPKVLVVTTARAAEHDVSKYKEKHEGCREVLLQGKYENKLHVRKAAIAGVKRCTCKAAAWFDHLILSESAWSSETPPPAGVSARTPPKVAVRLSDETYQFMELCQDDG
jgi:WD40 repeat protein